MMRESSSILPRLLRRPLTNMRQRSSAMAVSWLRRWMVGSVGIFFMSRLHVLLNPMVPTSEQFGARPAWIRLLLLSRCQVDDRQGRFASCDFEEYVVSVNASSHSVDLQSMQDVRFGQFGF